MKINEIVVKTVDLYHGTCESSAKSLIKNGWQPYSGAVGGNMGQVKYLYLSTDPEDALWFAQEKGCSTVIKVSDIPIDYLKVDPEDGISDTVEQEMSLRSGLPGKLVLFKSLDARHFSIVK